MLKLFPLCIVSNRVVNNKIIFRIALLAVLLIGGIYYLEGFFKPAQIQILYDIHPEKIYRGKNSHAAKNQNPTQFDVAFGLDQKYELTSLKIVPLDEWATNKQAHPLWHLISESNSVPIKAIIYGRKINGMHTAINGTKPEMLQINVFYHLLIEAGSREGECDFKLPALPKPVR
jgi:hypothetical protein